MALTDNLISYWKLDETSGTRNDSHGTNHLTDNNTVGYAAGKISNAADFEKDNSEYLSCTSNASLQTGDIDYSFSVWVKLESSGYWGAILSKDANWPQTSAEYVLHCDYNTSKFRWIVYNGVATSVADISWSATYSLDTWYHIVCWHSATNNEAGLVVNNGTPATASTSGAAGSGSDAFRIGLNVPVNYYDGLIEEAGFWKKVLTSQEITDLYNSGNALDYSSFSSQSALPLFHHHYRNQGIV